jgi:hypothetical protein
MNSKQRRKRRRLPKKEAFLQRVREQKENGNKIKPLSARGDSILTNRAVMLDYLLGSTYGKEQLFDIRPTC